MKFQFEICMYIHLRTQQNSLEKFFSFIFFVRFVGSVNACCFVFEYDVVHWVGCTCEPIHVLEIVRSQFASILYVFSDAPFLFCCTYLFTYYYFTYLLKESHELICVILFFSVCLRCSEFAMPASLDVFWSWCQTHNFFFFKYIFYHNAKHTIKKNRIKDRSQMHICRTRLSEFFFLCAQF